MSLKKTPIADTQAPQSVFRCKMLSAEADNGPEPASDQATLEEYGLFNNEDKKHGFCLVTNQATGKTFLGLFENDLADGYAVCKSGEEVYTGHFRKGKRHGIGRLATASATFDGTFRGNKLSGPGQLVVQSQSETRRGCFGRSGLEGFGELQMPGYHYRGFFKEGKAEGYGVETCEDGLESYCGYFEGGQRHGLGIMTRRAGGTGDPLSSPMKMEYSGEWFEGQRTGWGFLKKSNHLEYFGQFLRGIQMGIGETIFPDGAKYLGEYAYGRKAGFGKSTSQDQQTYIGEWLSDHKHGTGFGSDTVADWCYLGPWVMDKPGPTAQNMLAHEDSEAAQEFFESSRQTLFEMTEELHSEKQKLKAQLRLLKLDLSSETERLQKDLEEILTTTTKIQESVGKKARALSTIAWRNGIELPKQHLEELGIQLPATNNDGTFGGSPIKPPVRDSLHADPFGDQMYPTEHSERSYHETASDSKKRLSPSSSKVKSQYRISIDVMKEDDQSFSEDFHENQKSSEVQPGSKASSKTEDLRIVQQMEGQRRSNILTNIASSLNSSPNQKDADLVSSEDRVSCRPSNADTRIPDSHSTQDLKIVTKRVEPVPHRQSEQPDLKEANMPGSKAGIEELLDPLIISAIDSKYLFSDQRNQVSDLTNRLRLESLKKDKVVKKANPEDKPQLEKTVQRELSKDQELMLRIQARKKEIETQIANLDSKLKSDFEVCFTSRTQSST